MFSLSVEILSHPVRAALAAELFQQLQAQAAGLPVEVAWDQHVPVCVPSAPWIPTRHLWIKPTTASHRLVVQEDVAIAPDFLRQALRFIEYLPRVPISLILFEPLKDIQRAREQQLCWLVKDWCWEMQAMILPVSWAQQFVAWVDRTVPSDDHLRKDPQRRMADDLRLSIYCQRTQQMIWYCLPSLAEHRLPLYEQSIYFSGRKLPKMFYRVQRTAAYPWTRCADYAALDWTRGLDQPQRTTPGKRLTPVAWLLASDEEAAAWGERDRYSGQLKHAH